MYLHIKIAYFGPSKVVVNIGIITGIIGILDTIVCTLMFGATKLFPVYQSRGEQHYYAN